MSTADWSSSSVLNPWVRLPTLQLAWSAATVENVRSAALTQKTQPAGTRPVRRNAVADNEVAKYAAEDAKRFT